MATLNDEGDSGEPKRRYRKPQLTRVMLRPEEAVLGFCKNANKSGPLRAKCNVPSNCNVTGS